MNRHTTTIWSAFHHQLTSHLMKYVLIDIVVKSVTHLACANILVVDMGLEKGLVQLSGISGRVGKFLAEVVSRLNHEIWYCSSVS